VRDLAGGAFLAQLRNAVLVGGTGTGKTHLAIAIARSCIRSGARDRFYNVADLVNRLEAEARNTRQGRLADHLTPTSSAARALPFGLVIQACQNWTPIGGHTWAPIDSLRSKSIFLATCLTTSSQSVLAYSMARFAACGVALLQRARSHCALRGMTASQDATRIDRSN
jgi:hypothetical protein